MVWSENPVTKSQDLSAQGITFGDDPALANPNEWAYSVGRMIEGSDGIPGTLWGKSILMAHELGHQFSPVDELDDHTQAVRWLTEYPEDDVWRQTIMWPSMGDPPEGATLTYLPYFSDGTFPLGNPDSTKNNRIRFLESAHNYLPDD